jgi:Ala-tRNA(Pro) deacylase
LGHEEAYTAPEIAHTLHVSGKMLAKVVMIQADQRLVMAVLPSTWMIDFARLKKTLRCRHVRLATEEEFTGLFPDCDIGAMPPFGNLYDVPVYVDELLAKDEEIVFDAGMHSRAFKLRYPDFADLVHPIVAEFHQAPRKRGG